VQSNAPDALPEIAARRAAPPSVRLARLSATLLLAWCVLQAWWPLRGADDVWAHAAIGRWIWQHGAVPQHTLFLWGRPPIAWIYHSWLSQLLFYGLLEQGGPIAVVLLTVALSCLPFMLLWRVWERRAPYGVAAPFIFALAIWCSAPRFRPRPELFTALFLTLLLLFLIVWTRLPAREKTRVLLRRNAAGVLGLAVMFVLWANFHGEVAVGVAFLVLTALCDGLQDRGAGRARALAVIALLCAAAIWINPYGLEYSRALRPVGGVMFSAIDEWKPFWKHPVLSYNYAAGEAALVALALAAWTASARRRWAHAAWVLVMAVAFLDARRHLWLLALVCLAVIAASAPQWNLPRVRGWCEQLAGNLTLRRAAWPPFIAPFIFLWPLLLLGILLGATLREQSWPLRATVSPLPEGAARFLKRHPRARVFNDYEDSSYWQWRLAGHPPLYIDLLNAYPDDLMTDYLQIARASPRGRRLLDRLRVNLVVLRPRRANEGIARLAAYLDASAQWRRVYNRRDATIWQRSTPPRAAQHTARGKL
jgi:hypothetical protein